ncbi:HDIG domain-containing protein [Planctomycetota bacterium]|nr:HDIG domain-containing protein [Planctomycetota bacterium]
MANGKPSTARRREVRRNIGKQKSAFSKWVESIDRKDFLWVCFFVLLMTLIGGFITVKSTEHPTYEAGQLLTRPIVTRVTFQAEDKERTEEDRKRARNLTPNIYKYNANFYNLLRSQFNTLISLAKYKSIDEVPVSDLEINGQRIPFTQETLDALRNDYINEDGKPNEEWTNNVNTYLQRLFNQVIILNSARFDAERNMAMITVAGHPMAEPNAPPVEKDSRNWHNINATEDIRDQLNSIISYFPPALQSTVIEMTIADKLPTHDIEYQASTIRKNKVASEVPVKPDTYHANTVLVAPGKPLTDKQKSLIEQEQKAFLGTYTKDALTNMSAEQLEDLQHRKTTLTFARLGIFGMFFLITVCIWVYIYTYNKRIVTNPVRGIALCAILILCQAIAVFATHIWPNSLYFTATFPAILATIVLCIVYDQRFALAMGSALVAVIMISLNLSISFGLIVFAGIGICAAMLPRVSTRSTIVKVGAISGFTMGIATIIVGLATQPLYLEGEFTAIIFASCYALASGIFIGMCVQGSLPFIETVFHVTTAMTLRELNDASKPLLQRLAQEAPGTYQHSLRIADMAESAAEAIKGDPLLCRVGAMYHDIGKINKPMYFIENQGGGPNRHAKLSPAMSLLIIVGHVKDGIEMAREYGLPRPLRHFIESHHGTTLVEYFYHAAKKQKEAEEEAAPSEFEFRYPGPKPQTKEAAILLLCDGLEAAARTLPEPTPVRLEQLVSTIANKRLMDGQFAECNLTLSELNKIEQAIVKTLCAIYHARIKYPTDKPQASDSTDDAPQAKSGTA